MFRLGFLIVFALVCGLTAWRALRSIEADGQESASMQTRIARILFVCLGFAFFSNSLGLLATQLVKPGADYRTCLELSVQAVSCLAPLCLSGRLRRQIDFRVRWTWVALVPLSFVCFNLPNIGPNIAARPFSATSASVVTALLIGFVEETIFRGYAFLRASTQPRLTILTTSIIFAIVHVAWSEPLPEQSLHILFAFSMGLGFGAVRMVTKSLGLSILIHGFVDATAFTGGSEFSPLAYRVASMLLVTVSLAVVLAHPKLRPAAVLAIAGEA
jgi:membrane protease YdiL (CAAX protease family)